MSNAHKSMAKKSFVTAYQRGANANDAINPQSADFGRS
jgi:hypothetical protein